MLSYIILHSTIILCYLCIYIYIYRYYIAHLLYYLYETGHAPELRTSPCLGEHAQSPY